MKKILALAALIGGLGFSTMAQEAPKSGKMKPRVGEKKEMVRKSPEEFAKIRTERLDKELKFTDAQREKVYKLNLEQAKKQQAYQSKVQDVKKSHHAEMKAHHEKLQQVLTPDQQKMVKDKFAKRGKKDSVGRKGDRLHKQVGPESKKMKVQPKERS